VDPGVNFSCFVLWWTTPASASLKPDKRFGFDLQCQLQPSRRASLQFPEGTAPPARPDLLAARNALRRLRRLTSPECIVSDDLKFQPCVE
jgi:hypothetical protein